MLDIFVAKYSLQAYSINNFSIPILTGLINSSKFSDTSNIITGIKNISFDILGRNTDQKGFRDDVYTEINDGSF